MLAEVRCPLAGATVGRRVGAVVSGCLLSGLAVAAGSAEEWLNRMASAIETSNYRGTVVRVHDGDVETLRIVHKYADGEVIEKIETLDGADRTMIRDADGVRCVLPDARAILVEQSSTDSGLLSRVPVSLNRLEQQYDVILVRDEERIANRRAVMIAVRPHDEYRYGHRLWLDHDSALPVKTELLDEVGQVIEQVRFVDLTIEDFIPDSEFVFDINTQGFRHIGSPARPTAGGGGAAAERWVAQRLPDGFRLRHSLGGADGSPRQLTFDDGMVAVSVFIEPPEYDAGRLDGPSSMGAANAYSIWRDDRQITAIGEVPLRTVREIARSVARSE